MRASACNWKDKLGSIRGRFGGHDRVPSTTSIQRSPASLTYKRRPRSSWHITNGAGVERSEHEIARPDDVAAFGGEPDDELGKTVAVHVRLDRPHPTGLGRAK